MSLFPLDSIRNARIDQSVEPLLEHVRDEVMAFPHWEETGLGTAEEVTEAYDLARPRLNVLLSLLQNMKGRVGADIGAGLGFLPVLLGRCGVTTIATERDAAVSRFATAHGVEVRPYTIGRIAPPFERSSLDFVIFAEVLEHLKLPPLPVARELAALLRTGGRFILTTPNVARLQHLEALMVGENFLEPFPESIPPGADATDFVEHVREYSVREVVEAVEAAGLGVERVLMTGWGDGGYHPFPNPYVNEIAVVVATR